MVGACGESRKPKPFSPEVTTSIHKPIPSQSEGAECFYLYQEFLTAKEETHLKRSRDLARWRARSSEVRDKHKLPPLGETGSQPWTSRKGVNLQGVADSERQLDHLNVCFAVHKQRNPGVRHEDLIRELFCNPSQCVARLPVHHGRLPTITTSAEIYSYEHDCILSGQAHLRAMGWPTNVGPMCTYSNHECRTLAGEAFSLPCLSTVLYAYYLNPHAPWWHRGKLNSD